ncbi:hypothetical protein Tco_0221935 [Tanacetum coccineum]
MALGYQNPFYLKQAQQKQHSLYNGKVLLEKHDPPVVYDSEETLQLAQESFGIGNQTLFEEISVMKFMSIVQNSIVVETSDLQTELEPYKDMQQKIEWLQAQLGDQKGKSKDTLEPLSQKLEDENVELEFQLKSTSYLIGYSGHKDITKGTSVNTQFRKQSILRKPPSFSGSKLYYVTPFPKSKILPKIDESNALSKTSHFKLGTFHSRIKSCKNDKVIASGMFRINPFKTSREENFVPNKPANVSVRTKPITVLQPSVIHKQFVNSNSNGLSSTGLDNTAKTRMPQPKSNTKNDRVLSVSKSSGMNNKEVEVQEYHRNLLLSKNKKLRYGQEISQKRTRERMSDQEAKEIKAEARKIMPQPSTEREEMEGQDEEKKDREEGWELKFRAWSLYWSWMAAETPRVVIDFLHHLRYLNFSLHRLLSPAEAFWGADDEEISEGGIPRVIVLGYDGLPMQPVAPHHRITYQAYRIHRRRQFLRTRMSVSLSESQPLPHVDSPTAESPGYVIESNPEEDLEEYEDNETEHGPIDYPMDGRDDGMTLMMKMRMMRTRRRRST